MNPDNDDTKILIMCKDGKYQQYNFDKVCATQSQVRVCVSVHPREQADFSVRYRKLAFVY